MFKGISIPAGAVPGSGPAYGMSRFVILEIFEKGLRKKAEYPYHNILGSVFKFSHGNNKIDTGWPCS